MNHSRFFHYSLSVFVGLDLGTRGGLWSASRDPQLHTYFPQRPQGGPRAEGKPRGEHRRIQGYPRGGAREPRGTKGRGPKRTQEGNPGRPGEIIKITPLGLWCPLLKGSTSPFNRDPQHSAAAVAVPSPDQPLVRCQDLMASAQKSNVHLTTKCWAELASRSRFF